MKVGIREYTVHPQRAGTCNPAAVVLTVKVIAAQVASEQLTPDQARVFARQLLEAADTAEGGTL